MGKLILTEEFLNQVIAPRLLLQQKKLTSLSFKMEKNEVIYSASGKFVFNLNLSGTIKLKALVFNRREHKLLSNVTVNILQKHVKLFVKNPLKKILENKPGVSISGNSVSINLVEINT